MTTDRITVDPEVMQGKPVMRGTRITVDLLLRKLSEGATEADLLDAYPQSHSQRHSRSARLCGGRDLP